jgi:hypothetical protein
MHYTKLISEEHFTAGRPLVIVLPLAEEGTTNEKVGYLIEELHTSGRWPILVYNISYMWNGNMYTEINQHGSYIILTSGPCFVSELYIRNFWQQLKELIYHNNREHSWNPRAKFVVPVMSNCTQVENTNISRTILEHLWKFKVMNAAVLYLNSNKHAGNDLQQNTADSAQGTYLELHNWYPYENSDRCIPATVNVPVRIFTMENFSEFSRKDIFRGHFEKNFHGCRINVYVQDLFPVVYLNRHNSYNDPKYEFIDFTEWEIELSKVIGEELNMKLQIKEHSLGEDLEYLFVTRVPVTFYLLDPLYEYTRSYFSLRFAWYTPCAVKYDRWSRFFNIFSVDMWICLALSLVLALITIRCISNYGHKSHLHQSTSYSNIFSVTYNIIAVLLSVSVNTQPRTAPLRLFFFCWVCYSVAISTVFQAYLTTFLIESGYEEPIRTIEQMLKSEKKFGIPIVDKTILYSHISDFVFPNTSDPVDSEIVKDAVQCPDQPTCFIWAAVYHNISTVVNDVTMKIYSVIGSWADENNRPLLCEVDGGFVRTLDFTMKVKKGTAFFEFIEDVLGHIVEGGIFMHIKELFIEKLRMESNFDIPTFADTYYAISMTHLQTAFYLLLLGYLLAVACFVTEIMWHRYRSKGRGPTVTCLSRNK